MKHYITMSAMLFFASSSSVFGAPVIAPITEGEESIVNAIKQYSNLTEADVNQYKLLWLGSLGTYGAFVAGAISTIGAGLGVGVMQGMVPESAPSWLTNSLFLTGLGSAGTGYMSYKMLYPRIRAGVLNKVQRFIDVCQILHDDSPVDSNNVKYSIVSWPFNTLSMLQAYLPQSWPRGENAAIYNALYNLDQQGRRAELLLNQIGEDDDEIKAKRAIIKNYRANLVSNTQLYFPVVNEEDRKKRAAIEAKKQEELVAVRAQREEDLARAQLADVQANVGVKNAGAGLVKAKTIQTYGEMFADSVRSTWNGLNYIYKNKEKIAYRAGILSAAVYGGYVYLKNKLGYAG